MFATVTIKMEAESKEELDTFAAYVNICKDHFESLRNDGAFGPPDHVEMRYLIIAGKWRESDARLSESPNTIEVGSNGEREAE